MISCTLINVITYSERICNSFGHLLKQKKSYEHTNIYVLHQTFYHQTLPIVFM